MATQVDQLVAAPTPLDPLDDPLLSERGVTLWLKRDDLIHPVVPGNKFRKLKYNLVEAQRAGHTVLLTFGGAYSNHIYAVAVAGQLMGLRTIGVIRGEEHLPLNPVLATAVSAGMTLRYMDRETYRAKDSSKVLTSLKREVGDFALIPEGGSNHLGVRGCAEVIREISEPFDLICCPVGSGGTMAGLVVGLQGRGRALGFSALKGGSFLNDDVSRLLHEAGADGLTNWQLDLDHHFGGFARVKPELKDFMAWFEATHHILLDPIYVGKMMYGLFDLVRHEAFEPGTRIVALHTGGIPRTHWAGLMS